MSRNITNTRARGICAAASRLARRVFGSRPAGPARLRRANDDVLELFDFLQDAAFEDFEVVLRQVGDRRAVLRRVDVDADVVRFGAEGGRRRLRMAPC